MNQSRSREAAQRFQDRRKREDEAPRLSTVVPSLATLRLAMEERSAAATSGESKHVRIVVVERAPALFVIPCGDPACSSEGFDLTTSIMRELHAGKTSFTVEDECYGQVGSNRCGRVLRATGTATYR